VPAMAASQQNAPSSGLRHAEAERHYPPAADI
jgi:hypothetical protein